jgi:hypothetical protein
MSGCERQDTPAIELYFYDELDSGERAVVEAHLQTCEACRCALDELSVIRAALAARPDIAAPPGGDWTQFMSRLEGMLAVEPQAASVVRLRRVPPDRRYISYLAMAALLTLVTMSVAYVARVRNPSRPELQPPPRAATDTSGAAAPAQPGRSVDVTFATMTEQHLERSKLVVLGLASKDPHNPLSADWARERQLASSLLSDTRLYRLAAEQRGMSRVARIMSDLELVLLQASLGDERDAETLEHIKTLIRKRDLVTKIDIVNSSGL